jgi:hypothetical protein
LSTNMEDSLWLKIKNTMVMKKSFVGLMFDD